MKRFSVTVAVTTGGEAPTVAAITDGEGISSSEGFPVDSEGDMFIVNGALHDQSSNKEGVIKIIGVYSGNRDTGYAMECLFTGRLVE